MSLAAVVDLIFFFFPAHLPISKLGNTCGKQISRQTVACEVSLPAGTDVIAKQ